MTKSEIVVLGFALLAGCGATATRMSALCSQECRPAGFDATSGSCVCKDGGWSACACALHPIECAATGGPAPREWSPVCRVAAEGWDSLQCRDAASGAVVDGSLCDARTKVCG